MVINPQNEMDTGIKSKTFSTSTDGYSLILLTSDSSVIVVSVMTDQSAIVLPFINQYGMTYARVVAMNGDPVLNTAITGTFYYLKK